MDLLTLLKNIINKLKKFLWTIFNYDKKEFKETKVNSSVGDENEKKVSICPKSDYYDQTAKKILNPLAVKLLNYHKAIKSYDGEVPEGFSFIEPLKGIYKDINEAYTTEAMGKIITLHNSRKIVDTIASNKVVLEKLKGDLFFPFANFEKLVDIVERQESILSVFKAQDLRVKKHYKKYQDKVNTHLSNERK